MPDTTKLAQQLADQKARLQQQKETLARQQRTLDNRLAALTRQRTQARLLEAAHGEHLHQVTDVQTGRRRVETAIERDGTVRERLAQSVLVSGQGEQPPPLQLVDDVRHGSRISL